MFMSQAGYQGAGHVPIGIDFVISFAIGSAIVNIALWVVFAAYRYYLRYQYFRLLEQHQQHTHTSHSSSSAPLPASPPSPLLPNLHCQVMALPGDLKTILQTNKKESPFLIPPTN